MSNHGPRIGTKRDFMRFSEPPASGIFNQLLVDRVLSQQWHSNLRKRYPSDEPRRKDSPRQARIRISIIWIVSHFRSSVSGGVAPRSSWQESPESLVTECVRVLPMSWHTFGAQVVRKSQQSRNFRVSRRQSPRSLFRNLAPWRKKNSEIR